MTQVTKLDPKAIRRHFREHVEEWASDRYLDETYVSRGRMARGWLSQVPPGLVLDLGCGGGRQSLDATAYGHRVISADFAPEMVRQAIKRIASAQPNARPLAVVCDAQHPPFRPGTLDAVMTLGVIGYLPDPQAYLDRLSQIVRPRGMLVCDVAVPGSRVLFTVMSNLTMVPVRVAARLFRKSVGHDEDFYEAQFVKYRPRYFDTMMHNAGFRVEDRGGAGFGDIRLLGKAFLPWRLEMWISRVLSRVSRRRTFWILARHALIYTVKATRQPDNSR